MAQQEQKTDLTFAETLAKLWPHLRYLSLGIILAWLFLQIDYGAWRSDTDPNSLVAMVSNAWFFGGSCAVFVVAAFLPDAMAKALDWRGMGCVILGGGILGTAVLLLAGPVIFPGVLPAALQGVAFVGGSVMNGAVGALVTLQCAREYIRLEPGEVLFFALLSELVVFFVFCVVTCFDNFVPVPGSPSIAGMVGLCLLPAAAWYVLSLPDESEQAAGGAAGAGAAAGAVAEAGKPASGRASELHRGPSLPHLATEQRNRLDIALWRLFLAVAVFTFTVAIVRNAMAATQVTGDYQTNAQLTMLLRAAVAFILLALCATVIKRFPLEKFYLAASAVIALALALIMLVGYGNGLLSIIAATSFFLLDFLIWCLIILAAQSNSDVHPVKLAGIGRGAVCLGMLLGNAFALFGISGETLLANKIFAGVLVVAVLVCTVLVFNESRLLEFTKSIGKDSLSLQSVLDKTAAETALPPTRKATLWADACRVVGERGQLSDREQEILRQLADNRTPQDTADYLCISLHTVRTHTRNVYAKLDVHSRDELIALVRAEYEQLR